MAVDAGFGGFALPRVLLGPIGFVRRFVRRIAVWAVPFALYLTGGLDGAELDALWDTPGTVSVWQGADIVVAITVSVPLAADYTRFSTSRRAGGIGTGVGYFVPICGCSCSGSFSSLSRSERPRCASDRGRRRRIHGDRRAVRAPRDGDRRGLRERLLRVGLAQNLAPRAAGTPHLRRDRDRDNGALVIDLVSYQSFLLLLGSVFVPLFAVLLADWLAAGLSYAPADIFEAPAWRPGLIAAWLAGFALYQWLFPRAELVDGSRREAEPAGMGIGATVPSFLAAFAVASIVASRASSRGGCAAA